MAKFSTPTGTDNNAGTRRHWPLTTIVKLIVLYTEFRAAAAS